MWFACLMGRDRTADNAEFVVEAAEQSLALSDGFGGDVLTTISTHGPQADRLVDAYGDSVVKVRRGKYSAQRVRSLFAVPGTMVDCSVTGVVLADYAAWQHVQRHARRGSGLVC